MRHYQVPGVSIAVADGGRLAWARGFGVRRQGAPEAVTPDTPFEAASISKVLAATLVLRLVDQGRLDLDADVNRYLRSWRVPRTRLTAREKVTLRRILSHSSGLDGHSVREYPVAGPLPTLPQVLEGRPPSRTPAVKVISVPGTKSAYSGSGLTVAQLLLTEVSGKSFETLAREQVLGPVGMDDSAFEQPIPPALRARASAAHDVSGRPIDPVVYVDLAAAGLWSTPRDLLRWAMAIDASRAGRPGERPPLLSQARATEMLKVQKGSFGLGPYLEGEGAAFSFSHAGWNDGFHSRVIYFPATGQGAAVMVNGAGGRPLVTEILQAIAAEYRWPAPMAPREIEVVRGGRPDPRVPSPSALAGTYASPPPLVAEVTVVRDGDRLFAESPQLGTRTELLYTGPRTLVGRDTGDPFNAITAPDGTVTALKLGFLRLERRPPRGPGDPQKR
jgi:CubicO group peptidase (beta-lactamase class C family)